jgi:hypothetical protein
VTKERDTITDDDVTIVGDLGINNHSSAKIKINQPNNFSKRKNIE